MAARVIAQLLVKGGAILSTAFVSAYQQALRNAKAGGAPISNKMSGKKIAFKMQPAEALQILDIEKGALTDALLKERYAHLFEANEPSKGGSFYLQSKIYRSREVLDYQLNPPPEEPEEEAGAEGVEKGAEKEEGEKKKMRTSRRPGEKRS
ncbi:Pam16-domain-containing protein [Ochromonadaceae sp. CCMP2298]|nr:Pam16-domain-containing protein [Ochromonadaceae sp. CCMP2298]|mmetsp:Transcript_12326/g.27442  ORF Transcript_12326/g.27442 Transcript_12326/m.27442 type:complete len:151 (+) Transcript_12326:182-634(+)|eukprot:CAMPEP_0173192794 /NCGR_PEP_ID=MMETSP1141-20130122/13611_1 /TAXON_ID=483371 /ORGANISM="non described non described, Strain CCMP2298" /LENGTH=150 /DNA_ID=CAMNT_0014117079 /DNA_START=147 /DNA_END=599 /DNA_ORIENTATION=+